MTDVPRDPGYYHPTTHSKQMRRERDIDWNLVSTTITDGKVKHTHKPNCRLFIHDFPHTKYPIGVVASIKTGEIITVEYRK